jgi:hypothetical protein
MEKTLQDDNKTYTRAPIQVAHAVRGAEVVDTLQMDAQLENMAEYVGWIDEAEREKIAKVGAAASRSPYKVSSYRLIMVPNATVFNFPRVEGMVLDQDGTFVKETRGSPRILPGNNYIRSPDNEHWYFSEDTPYDGELETAFIPFDPATHNYAHFLGVYLQRVMMANRRLQNMPFFFPDSPDYRSFFPGAMRNEFMYRLQEIYPLSRGNFYSPLPLGKFRVRRLFLVQHIGNRWDLMFYPEVSQAFKQIGEEAVRRYKIKSTRPAAKRVFVSRRGAVRRHIVNENEVAHKLELFGYSVMEMERLDFWDQAACFAAAEAIVGLHGAGCASVLFCSDETKFVEIHPDPLPSLQFVHSAVAQKCLYLPLSSKKLNRWNDVRVDLERLNNLLSYMHN